MGGSLRQKRAMAFVTLVKKLMSNGMNVWDARIAARKLLDHPVQDYSHKTLTEQIKGD